MGLVHLEFLPIGGGADKNVLVVTDLFTKYAQAYVTVSQSASEVAKTLFGLVCISTAEHFQLCYTNRYGVVVVVGVVVIVGVVNFFSSDVSIEFLPLVRIIWIKEHLITTDSYWRLQFRCWWWKKQIIL